MDAADLRNIIADLMLGLGAACSAVGFIYAAIALHLDHLDRGKSRNAGS